VEKYQRSIGANEILQMIFTYMTEVSSLREHDDIIFVLANMGKALTNADRCTVWVVDDEEIWTKVAHGMDAIRLPKDSGIVGNSITSGKKIIIDDVYNDSRFNPNIDKKTGYRTKSMMVIPMFDNDDEIIGAFQVINHLGEDGIFEKRDMERLMLASTYAAETLIAASLTKEIEETQKEVVLTMGAIGESRSKETGNHVKRVAAYSKILALAYGMSESEAELLKQASPMHDIGKIAIPDSILNKPGRFNDEERAIMDTHAELGHAMIKDSKKPLLKAASIVAYEHHEKYNGQGYPRKKKGEDIHIYGRITALADVFDALGSDRVYKKAWADEKVFKLLKEERGEHFDPVLIDLFFENLDKILKVRQEYKDNYQESVPKERDTKEIQILGAYGTRAKGFGTSSFLLNKHNVIDAGNIVATLNEESVHLETVWLTHSHLDHISDIAFILDNFFSQRSKTLTIKALGETIQTLKEHFFNDLIWPDFSKINLVNSELKALSYEEIELGVEYTLNESDSIRAFETDHTVASCGYIFTRDGDSVLITADTYSLQNVIEIIDTQTDINSIVIECSFPSSMPKLAKDSKHLTPKLLFESIQKIKREDIKLYINHIKPSYLEKIVKEIKEYRGKMTPIILKDEDFIIFSKKDLT